MIALAGFTFTMLVVVTILYAIRIDHLDTQMREVKQRLAVAEATIQALVVRRDTP